MSSSRARTTLAAQACETCRKRKTKCDELRPKCSLCQRLNVECSYKEPPPERKDEAMVRILDSLQRLESKFENLSMGTGATLTRGTIPSPRPSSSRTPLSGVSTIGFQSEAEKGQSGKGASPYLTVPHKILLWPSIRYQLVNSGMQEAEADLQSMSEGGTPWLLKQEFAKHPQGLPFDVGLPSYAPNVGVNESSKYSLKVSFPTLTTRQVQRCTDAYFNTFNVLHPILDYSLFINDTLEPLLRSGFGYGDPKSILCLTVIALGQLAIDGISGEPITSVGKTPSGIRGGTLHRPPGLDIFNEARARLGSITLQTEVVGVQLLLLQAAYFEANACHVEYWRSIVAASMACQVLIQTPGIQWATPNGDLIKRAYWTCVMDEDLYHLELDLPRTAIHEYEDVVPFPHFNDAEAQPENTGSARVQYYFLARIAIKKVITRIHEAIHYHSNQPESSDGYGGPPMHVIREMARQLDSWRSMLPRPLQWSDSDVVSTASINVASGQPNPYEYGLEMLTAELRTRFYYARFILYRPFIFKALHFPEHMSGHDVECCAFAIKSACMWPVAMAPTRERKRLIPHLFTWTQNFMGILFILWMLQNTERLSQFAMELLDPDEIQQTIVLLLQWIEDVKQVDGIAEWSWRMLEPLFAQSA